jgi:hypothetical protein
MAAARARPKERRSLIHRWATFEGETREAARSQLEQAAMLVPEEKRSRVLGPLHSDDDKQAMVAVGVVLLGKLLSDQGWQVEHEPEIAGQTPDLRIRKGAIELSWSAARCTRSRLP